MNYTDTRIFLDTNIISYMFDSKEMEKQVKARKIVAELVVSNNCHISTQVLQEAFNVLTKKLNYTKEESRQIVMNLMNMPIHQITVADISDAMDISNSTQFTIYDSLILSAAKAEKCNIVYSEDLNDGQEVDGVKIINPFKIL